MKDIYHTNIDSMYDEVSRTHAVREEQEVKLPSVVPSKVLTRPTPTFQDFPVKRTLKRWNAPQFPREKLVEKLNTLEEAGCEIFTILTVSTSHVQVVYYEEREIE